MNSITVIVTNWNGLRLLKINFTDVIKNSPEASEILFADDHSDDESVNYIKSLKKLHPQVKILTQSQNIGFSKNSNNAVWKAKGDYVVLLNNDIIPHPGYISNSLSHFQKKDIFGVSFSELDHENWARLKWQEGYLQHEPVFDTKTHISGWVSGGSSIIDRQKFLKLGGFDPIYSPFYSEDLDLGFRAWKSGYTLLWEPKSVVEHKHESTISKFPKRLLDYVKERNRLLTVLRNITDPKLLFDNRLAQIFRVLSGPNYIKIIMAAKRQLKLFSPPVVFPKLTDKEIFKLFT